MIVFFGEGGGIDTYSLTGLKMAHRHNNVAVEAVMINCGESLPDDDLHPPV